MSNETSKEQDRPLLCHEVYRMPEFQALCLKLGILWEADTQQLTIEFQSWDKPIKITHVYHAESPARRQQHKIDPAKLKEEFMRAVRPACMPKPDRIIDQEPGDDPRP